MKKLLLLSIVSAPLILSMGCDGQTTDPGCEGAECTEPCEGDDCTDPDPDGFNASVIVTLPDGASGTIVLGDTTTPCNGSCAIERTEPYSGMVEVDCPGHLFVPKSVEVSNGDQEEVIWNNDGSDWGLAPNGRYVGQVTGQPYEIETRIPDGLDAILIYNLPISPAFVTGDTFQSQMVQGTENYVTGTISEDLTTIHLQIYDNGELFREEDAVLQPE